MEKKYIKSLYEIITKKTITDESDPIYILIEEKLIDFKIEDKKKFFMFFSTSSEYFTDKGFSSIIFFQKAIKDYKDALKDTLWIKYNIEEKAELLTQKIIAITEQQDFRNLYREAVKEKTDKMEKHLDNFTTHSKPLFNEDEQSIIKSIGLYNLVKIYMDYSPYSTDFNVLSSCYELKERISNEYRTLYTIKYFGIKDDNKQQIGFKGNNTSVACYQTKSLMETLARSTKS